MSGVDSLDNLRKRVRLRGSKVATLEPAACCAMRKSCAPRAVASVGPVLRSARLDAPC